MSMAMRITFVTRIFGNVERNSHCDVLHITPIRVANLAETSMKLGTFRPKIVAETDLAETSHYRFSLLSSINFTKKAPKVPYIKTLLDDIEQATTVSTAAVPQPLALTNNANTYELYGRRWNKDWSTSKDDQTRPQ